MPAHTTRGLGALLVIAAAGATREDRITGTMQLGLIIALSVSNFTESQLFSPSNPIGYMFVVVAVQAERWLLRAKPPLSVASRSAAARPMKNF